jgi:hypothetical protein
MRVGERADMLVAGTAGQQPSPQRPGHRSRAGPQRQGQEAVRDGAAERPGRALRVDVDPLVVTSGVGEQGDLLCVTVCQSP